MKSYIEWEEYRASKIPGPSDTGTLTKKQELGGSIMGGEFPKVRLATCNSYHELQGGAGRK